MLASCAAPPQAAGPQTSASAAATVSTVDTAQASNDDDYETIFVPAPTGSLLGGGAVRVPKRRVAGGGGNDEKALLGDIRRLNAAAGAPRERPYVVSAVSRATGVSERELQAQQDVLQLRFGELCAINAIARGNSDKVQEIAGQRSKGRSWTDLAKANGLSIGTVVQTTRNASELTERSFSNAADREKGGDQKVKELGVRPQVRPGN
ncbi:MAG TPA: hypothetical protein VH207_11230 [Chthoniobacterales bacterium]|nr:hypothetical protein [Chthoniobacterales bacterium]